MKKLLLLLATCVTTHLGMAQSAIKAGAVELGGGFNYMRRTQATPSSYGTYTYTSSVFAATPYLGYIVANNLTVGLSLGYQVEEDKGVVSSLPANPTYRTFSSLRIGPYVRYYKMLTEQFGLTGTLSAGYARDSEPASNSAAPDVKRNGFYASLVPGVIFLPIPKLGLGASIGGLEYSQLRDSGSSSNSSSSGEVSSTFAANFGLAQLTLSGTYFLGR